MLISVFAILLVVQWTGVSASGRQCACASVDTIICNDYPCQGSFGTLSAPNCLPYLGDQRAELDGRIYANVSYYEKPAWLLTSDIYIKDCEESFGCVCSAKNDNVYVNHDMSTLPFATLKSGECSPVTAKTQTCGGEVWIPVIAENKPGWIKKKKQAFHTSCSRVSDCPCIISRAEWGARQPRLGVLRLKQTPNLAIVHHGASAACQTREECVRIIQSYQNFHLDGRRWSDIGYNFLIGEDGNVYEGRGWDAVGAHTRGYNSKSLGFVVIGNFTERAPSTAAMDKLRQIISCGVARGKLAADYTLYGRRDLSRAYLESPGEQLYRILQQWEHYNQTVKATQGF